MKRWIFWSIASVLTFGFGCAIVFAISFLSTPITQERPLPLVEKESTVTKVDDFVPEFPDLPNFDDIEYKKPPGKLIEILQDGIYRRSDVVARNGEEWLVLSGQGDKLSFASRRAQVRNLSTNSWPGDELDAKLSFNVRGKPIIAVRDLAGLKPGKIETLFHKKLHAEYSNGYPDYEEISDGFRREFVLGQRRYVLRTSDGLTKNGTKIAVLILETNDKVQVLKQIYQADPTHEIYGSGDRNIFGSLLWVGDMDGDGHLDLYFDEFNEKGFTYTELHLSTLSKSGKLVGLAADFGMAGC